MKKKILALAMAAIMLIVAVVGGTLAYFTDEDAATNVITIGNVDITLYESKYHRGAIGGYLEMDGQPNPTSDEEIKKDAEKYQDYLEEAVLMPFDLSIKDKAMFQACTVAKNAYIENTGDNNCFVRVRYMVPVDIAPYLDIYYVNTQFVEVDGELANADARTLDNTDKNEPVITNVVSSKANFKEQVNYLLSDDGKYYVAEFIYLEYLTPDEFTLYSPVSKITLIPSVTNDTMKKLGINEGRQFEIIVEADAIQADGFLNAKAAFTAFDAQITVPQN